MPETPKSITVCAQASSSTKKREPHYSPKMDDDAASQQLRDELEYSIAATPSKEPRTLRPINLRRTTGRQAPGKKAVGPRQKKRPAQKTQKTVGEASLTDLGASCPPPAVQQDTERNGLDLHVSRNPDAPVHSPASPQAPPQAPPQASPVPDVEVPDSQTLLPAFEAPVSPPMTSNLPILSSSHKARGTTRQHRPSESGKAALSSASLVASTQNIAYEITTPPRTQRKRLRSRKSYTSPVTNPMRGLAHDPSSKDEVTVPASSTTAPEGAQTQGHTREKTKTPYRMHGSRPWRDHGIGDHDIEDDLVDGKPNEPKRRLQRIKKTKPWQTTLTQNSADTDTTSPGNEKPASQTQSGVELAKDLSTSEAGLVTIEEPEDTSPAEINQRSGSKSSKLKMPSSKRPNHRRKPTPRSTAKAPPMDPLDEPVDVDENDGTQHNAKISRKEDHGTPVENDMEREAGGSSSGDDEIPCSAPPGHNSEPRSSAMSKRPKQHRNPRKYKNPPRIRRGNHKPDDGTTAADRALELSCDLNIRPELRVDGDFTPDEEELIRRALRDFQARKELDTIELVDIIHHNLVEVDEIEDSTVYNKQQEDMARELWLEIKDIGLKRQSKAIRRHVRSKYHAFKSGGWTKEEDDLLRSLHELHPAKWKLISQTMATRSMHDCHNRYRDYVQPGAKRNTSVWSKDEEKKLVHAVNTVCQRIEDHRAETGQPPLDEFTSHDINWPQVSIEIGGIRSRLQCSEKWKKMQRWPLPPRVRVEIKPRKERSSPEFSPTTSKKRKRTRESDGTRGSIDKKAERPKRQRRTKTMTARHSPAEDDETSAQVDKSKNPWSIAHASDLSEMQISDKFHLVCIIAKRCAELEDIPWEELVAAAEHTWSQRTLQTTLNELLQEHKERTGEEEPPLQAALSDIGDYLVMTYPEEFQTDHNPFKGLDSESDSGVVPETEDEPAAANMKKKRQQGLQISQSYAGKGGFKSKETIESGDSE
ncbi:RNA polymerase I enhancer binding protein [Coniothyrium glycines]